MVKTLSLFLSLMLLYFTGLGCPAPAAGQPETAAKLPMPQNGTGSSVLSPPVYDSGWVDVGNHNSHAISVELIHNLGGDLDSYLLDLQCWDDGGMATYNCVDQNFLPNAYWHHLTSTNVRVKVIAGTRPDDIRLRIYQIPPDYDSDWTYITTRPDPISLDFTHNLGTVEGIVDLTCFSTANGFFDCTGLENGSFARAALWHHLDANQISVKVRGGDQPSEVRVRLFNKAVTFSTLRYNDQTTDPVDAFISLPFNTTPDIHLIQIRCIDPDGGLNECTDQGFAINANWSNLYGFAMYVRYLPDPDRQLLMKFWANFPQYTPLILRD